MARVSSYAYLVLAWVFLAGMVIQVFAIGMALFGEPSFVDVHAGLGWVLHLAPILILLAAYLARAGSRHWQWALALVVVVLIVPVLATMRDATTLAALHPVGAVVAFALSVVVAWNSLSHVRATVAGAA